LDSLKGFLELYQLQDEPETWKDLVRHLFATALHNWLTVLVQEKHGFDKELQLARKDGT
jgi:hypothetical protein